MSDLTSADELLTAKINSQHRALLSRLSEFERDSMAKYVNSGNIETIQAWIGDDRAIEQILFWDRGGKYDDPAWQALLPVDQATRELYQQASSHYARLRKLAVEVQRRSDLTLYSQFNPGLLYSGLSGAVRCGDGGAPGEGKGFFRGISLRLVGSVEDEINSLSILPQPGGGYRVHLGESQQDREQGIWVHAGDAYSLLQVAQLAEKVLPKAGFVAQVLDSQGRPVKLDPRAIRRAAMGEGPAVVSEPALRLLASRQADNVAEALEAADTLATRLYERLGLEIEAAKIGRKYGNFFILREDNFETFLPPGPSGAKALILLTATLVCRRCRRELKDFRDAARDYPNARFALVNLSSPQFKFYERVFGDMGGGNPDEFRRNAAGVTPFIIAYKADDKKVLKFEEYIATDKDHATPNLHREMARLIGLFM